MKPLVKNTKLPGKRKVTWAGAGLEPVQLTLTCKVTMWPETWSNPVTSTDAFEVVGACGKMVSKKTGTPVAFPLKRNNGEVFGGMEPICWNSLIDTITAEPDLGIPGLVWKRPCRTRTLTKPKVKNVELTPGPDTTQVARADWPWNLNSTVPDWAGATEVEAATRSRKTVRIIRRRLSQFGMGCRS